MDAPSETYHLFVFAMQQPSFRIRAHFFTFLGCAIGLAFVFATPSAKAQTSIVPAIEEFRLKNGLRVMLVEDKTQARILLQAQYVGGNAMIDVGGKEGTSALLLQTLRNTLQTRIDAANARLNDSSRILLSAANSVDASSLILTLPKNSLQTALTLASDALSRPSFLAADIQISRKDIATSKQARSAANAHAAALATLAAHVVYGAEHPYSRQATLQSLAALNERDIQAAHQLLCVPGNMALVIVGNVSKKALAPMLAKTFGLWKSGEVPYIPRPRPLPPEHGIALVDAPLTEDGDAGASASKLASFALVFDAPPRNDMDYEALALAMYVLESRMKSPSLGSMLARTMLSEHRYANDLVAVQRLPTLSAAKDAERVVAQMRTEMKRLSMEIPALSELATAKKALQDRFAATLRSPQALSELLALAAVNDIPLKTIRSYPKRLADLTPEAVQTAANRYLQPERGMIVLTDSTTLQTAMGNLRALGKVVRYTSDGEPIVNLDSADISLDSLLTLHTKSLGGTTATMRITTLTTQTQTQLSAMAQKFPGTIITKQKVPNKIARKLEITATQIVQELWFDGKTAFDKMEMMGQEQPLAQRSSKETESALFDAQIFPALTMRSCGFAPELLGKRDGAYIVKATTPNGTVKTLVFDATTYLLASIEEMRQTPQGIIQSVQEFREYALFEGVQLPTTVVMKTGPGTLIGKSTYQINQPIGDEVFQVRK